MITPEQSAFPEAALRILQFVTDQEGRRLGRVAP